MRKRLITPKPQSIRPHDEGWLDLDRAASVEVTSEEGLWDRNPERSPLCEAAELGCPLRHQGVRGHSCEPR
jgi:hypothetical protein